MAVSAPDPDNYDGDERIVAMLAAWKAEVAAEPIPELVDSTHTTPARTLNPVEASIPCHLRIPSAWPADRRPPANNPVTRPCWLIGFGRRW